MSFLKKETEKYWVSGQTFVHSPLPDDGHAVLQAVDAVRDLGEIVFAQSFLNAVECAVVSAGALKVTWDNPQKNVKKS